MLPEGGQETLALWTLYTYVFDALDVSPFLTLTSPQKRCGKSTVLTVASSLVHRPLLTSNISPPSLFRTIEAARPTLLIDEVDTFSRHNEELRGVLNAGHTRRTTYTIRTVGDDHASRVFATWAPKMLSGIGKIPDTLRDRAIIVKMARKKPSERVEKWRERVADTLLDVRRRCVRWAEDTFSLVESADPTVPDFLNDRAADNWATLLAVAAVAGGDWPARARQALRALEQDAHGEDDENAGILLLEDIHDVFVHQTTDRVTSHALVEALHAMEERPWSEWGRQRKPITQRQVAKLLAPFGIRPRGMRISPKNTPRGYDVADCEDSFARYLGSRSATPQQPSNDATFADFRSATEGENVADENMWNPAPHQPCCGVADETGGRAEATDVVHEEVF